jgi:hypothetical protein
MIRPEHARKAKLDAATEQKLAELRSTFTGLTDSVARVASQQRRSADVAASKARSAQTLQGHARLEAALESGRRAPERAYFLRPYGLLDKELWQHQELRGWYGGGASGTLAGPHFGTGPLGAELAQQGYTRAAAPERAHEGKNPYRPDAPRPEPVESALNTARMAAQQTWRASANRTHWMDREALLPLEQVTARAALGATGFSQDLVQTSRPFKSRSVAEDSWRFLPPEPAALRSTMEAQRVQGAREGVGNVARAAAAHQRGFASDPSSYF